MEDDEIVLANRHDFKTGSFFLLDAVVYEILRYNSLPARLDAARHHCSNEVNQFLRMPLFDEVEVNPVWHFLDIGY